MVKVYSAAKVRSHQQKTSRTKFWPHVHTDRIAFAPARKSYRIALLFTHNNGGFGGCFSNGAKLHPADFGSGSSLIYIGWLSVQLSLALRTGCHVRPLYSSCRYDKLSGIVQT